MSDEEKSVAIRQDAVASPGALLSAMLELARDPSFDASKFEALANLQLKMEDRAADRELADAIQAIQSEIPPVTKDGKIPKGGKDGKPLTYIPFATYEHVMEVLQPFLNQHKIAVTFSTAFENLKIVTTATARKGTATVTSSVPMPIDEGAGRNSAQSHVSSMSYGKRNAVEALFNIVRVGADDDGNTADLKLMDGEQVATLTELVTDGGITAQEVLGHFFPAERWVSFEEVPASEFGRLRQSIEARNRRKAPKKGHD